MQRRFDCGERGGGGEGGGGEGKGGGGEGEGEGGSDGGGEVPMAETGVVTGAGRIGDGGDDGATTAKKSSRPATIRIATAGTQRQQVLHQTHAPNPLC